MAIRPVDMGIIQRTDDVGIIKHQQDSKPMIQQQNVQTQMERRDEMLTHQVTNSEQGSKLENHTDAKEEGKNAYFFHKKKKEKKNEKTGDRVIKKDSGFGFDVKI